MNIIINENTLFNLVIDNINKIDVLTEFKKEFQSKLIKLSRRRSNPFSNSSKTNEPFHKKKKNLIVPWITKMK